MKIISEKEPMAEICQEATELLRTFENEGTVNQGQ